MYLKSTLMAVRWTLNGAYLQRIFESRLSLLLPHFLSRVLDKIPRVYPVPWSEWCVCVAVLFNRTNNLTISSCDLISTRDICCGKSEIFLWNIK